MTESRKPVQTVRQGMIQAAIWRNSNEKGNYYTATFERRYRDGEEWKSTHGFGRDDLLIVAKVADLAHTAIHELQKSDKTSKDKDTSAESGEGDPEPAKGDQSTIATTAATTSRRRSR